MRLLNGWYQKSAAQRRTQVTKTRTKLEVNHDENM